MDPAASRPAAPQRALLSSAGRALLWLGPVYLAGYLGLSGSWLLLGLALALGWARNRRGKRERLAAASVLLEDEREAVRRGLAARRTMEPRWQRFEISPQPIMNVPLRRGRARGAPRRGANKTPK